MVNGRMHLQAVVNSNCSDLLYTALLRSVVL